MVVKVLSVLTVLYVVGLAGATGCTAFVRAMLLRHRDSASDSSDGPS